LGCAKEGRRRSRKVTGNPVIRIVTRVRLKLTKVLIHPPPFDPSGGMADSAGILCLLRKL
jgi:hypothetical protein